MNRVFLILFILMLALSYIEYLRHKKHLPPRQRWVISTLYALTVIGLIALQFQYNLMLPTGHFVNFLTPRVKMWVEHLQ